MSFTSNSRELRGKAIADQGNQIKKVNDRSFKVKSQSGGGFYEVKATESGMTCDCPDFVYRGGKCKHIAATRYYLEIDKETPTGIVTEKVHLTYTQALIAYNEAQKAEVNLFDELLKDLVKVIPEPERTTGRPRLSIHETPFCAIQKVYSQLSSRRAYSLFQNATGKGQISHPLHFNTPSKLFNKPELTPILYKLIMHSALPVAGLERKKMYHYFQLNRDDFMEHYHKRSNIEATNAAI